jgi:hypothetical protein
MTSFNYTLLKPYVITLTRNSPSVNYDAMKKTGVSGVVVEAGYLYTATDHKVVSTFRNPSAYDQTQSALDATLSTGWLMYGRAKTVVEASAEIYQLSFLIRKYPPMIGVWIDLGITGQSRPANDMILDRYRDELVKLGLSNRIGIRATKETIKKITWSDKQHDWKLWLVDHVAKLDEINQLLDPTFFDMEKQYV